MKLKWLIRCVFLFAVLMPAIAFCDGENFLFYNSNTGAGAVGHLTGDEFHTTKTFPNGSFANWTHIANVDGAHTILFYNTATGAGADGALDYGDFKTTNTYTNFAHGWTQILNTPLHNDRDPVLALFYDAGTGSGAIGYAPTIHSYPNGAFARGWTHIVANVYGIFFYNARTGEGAIAIPAKSASIGNQNNWDAVKTTRVYKPGKFTSNWTHVVSVYNAGKFLFYNSFDGSAAVGEITPNTGEFQTDRAYPAESFARGWTHIVPNRSSTKILFYNSTTGEGAIAELLPDNSFKTTKVYPPNSFARGWTHVVSALPDSSPPKPPK